MSTRLLRLFLLSAAAGCAEHRSLTTEPDGATPDAFTARPLCTGEDIAVEWRFDIPTTTDYMPDAPVPVEGDGFYWMARTENGFDLLRLGPDLELGVAQRFPRDPNVSRNLFAKDGALHFAEWDQDKIRFGPLEGPLQSVDAFGGAEATFSVQDAGEARILVVHQGYRNGIHYSVYRGAEREETGDFPGGEVHPRRGQRPMYSIVTQENHLMAGEFGGTPTRLPTPGCGSPTQSGWLWHDEVALSDGAVAWVYSCDGAGVSVLSKRTVAGAVLSVEFAPGSGDVSLAELPDGTLLTATSVDGNPVLGLFDGDTLSAKGSSMAPRPVYRGDIPGGGTFAFDGLAEVELTPAAIDGTFLLAGSISIPDGRLRVLGVGILCPPT